MTRQTVQRQRLRMKDKEFMREIYLDNSATTRCFDPVIERMAQIYRDDYGNPSSAHHKGVTAEARIREATETLAKILRCKPEEILYTSGGTESDNLALLGTLGTKRGRTKVITTSIEHPAILRTAERIAVQAGADPDAKNVIFLPVDKDGIVCMDALEEAIDDETLLVSVMHTNNEIGSLQPVEAIGKMLKAKHPDVLFHVDAVQGFGKALIYPGQTGIDLMSVSAHKIHGPKGVGFLYIRKGVRLNAQITGGGQQKDLRSGTENVPGIAGMALAAGMLYNTLSEDTERLYELKSAFIGQLLQTENVFVNGIPGHPGLSGKDGISSEELKTAVRRSAPHIISASFPGVRSEVLLHALEEEGIYVSAGSACATHKAHTSETLAAIGLPKERLDATLRFSMSVHTTREELDAVIGALGRLLPDLQRYSRR